MINYKDEVLKRKDDLIKDLTNLLKINSELTKFDPNSKTEPFGPGNKEALLFMLDLGKKDGFNVLNVDYYAGHIEFGSSVDYIGSIGHLDVVPAGTGWTYPPYEAEIHDNKIYARGTEDDKGPTMAFYYAMKILKELDVKLSKRIKLVIGIDEESGWRCVRHYFSKYPEQPVMGFIPDANFPLIYAEKGIFRLEVKGKTNKSNLLSLKGGLRDNMVPESAEALLVFNEDYQSLFNNYLKKNNLVGSYQIEDNNIKLTVEGKSAHGSTPEEGVNAVDLLISFLLTLNLDDDLLKIYQKYFLNDLTGQKFNIDIVDDEMGHLTTNLGVINYENNEFSLTNNIRYPKNTTFDHIMNKIKNKITENLEITVNHHQKLLYENPNSKLVKTLLDVYKNQTGDHEAKPLSIGGGTFARAMQNTVAYGPHFPNKPSYIHQKDEYIEIDDLLLATSIYLEALYKLAK